jgi:hypothetical protein
MVVWPLGEASGSIKRIIAKEPENDVCKDDNPPSYEGAFKGNESGRCPYPVGKVLEGYVSS